MCYTKCVIIHDFINYSSIQYIDTTEKTTAAAVECDCSCGCHSVKVIAPVLIRMLTYFQTSKVFRLRSCYYALFIAFPANVRGKHH